MKLDVGCGYRGDIHYPNLDFDVFLEPFLNNSKPEWIKVLRDAGTPIMASAQDLPFRKGVISRLQCRAVMEHLPRPFKALADFKYVLGRGGIILIVVPIICNHYKHYFIEVFTAFPFGLIDILACMRRLTSHWHEDGLAHVSDVQPENVTPFFKRTLVKGKYYRHKWFYGLHGKFIRKFITRGREPIHDIQGYWEIYLQD